MNGDKNVGQSGTSAMVSGGPTPAQLKAAQGLANGLSTTAAALAAGVDRRTVNRWKRDDAEFVAALNAARADSAETFEGEVRGLASDAVRAVRKVIRSKSSPAGVRLKAALAVLEKVDALDRGVLYQKTDADEIRARQAEDEAELAELDAMEDD